MSNTRINGLDGLRGILAIIIVAGHSYVPFLTWQGRVDVFFVISGFLITGILTKELDSTGRIDLVRFWAKRARKLVPPLLILCAGVMILWPQYHAAVWAAATLATDYHQSLVADVPTPLLHTWSLAVEEHFYLLWPLVMLGLRYVRRSAWLPILLVLFCACGVWRNLSYDLVGTTTYYRFDPRLSGLVAGSMLSLAGRDRRWIVAIIAVASAVAAFGLSLGGVAFDAVLSTPAAITVGLLVIAALQEQDIALLSNKVVAWIGRQSYGVYLFHFPIVCWVNTYHGWQLAFTVGLGGSLAIAAAYGWLERKLA